MPASASATTNGVIDRALRIWVLIPCAGSGQRAGEGLLAKQYRSVAGKPMVLHTVDAFAQVRGLAGGALVVAPGDGFFNEIDLPDGWIVADCGGGTRALSVVNGLSVLAERGADPSDWVLVHDAARCLVTPAQIEALILACQRDEVGGLLAVPLADTLKRSASGRVRDTEERGNKWLAQTPQMFRLGLLRTALEQTGAAATDESSAVESLGLQPLLVTGSSSNFKVTWQEDFALAEAILHRRSATAGTALSAAAPALDPLIVKGQVE